MKPGKRRSFWQAFRAKRWLLALIACAWLAGCRSPREHVDTNLMQNTGPTTRSAGVAESYVLLCPDVLDIQLANHPELSGPHPIGVDGRIDLAPLSHPRVEGETTAQVAQQLAQLAALPFDQVTVRVSEYRAQCIYLFGEVNGLQRAVPYQGQETVLDLLKRTGGITKGAAPDEVYVVRTHVGDNKRPEVFHVNLPAIVMKHDERTNLRLLPLRSSPRRRHPPCRPGKMRAPLAAPHLRTHLQLPPPAAPQRRRPTPRRPTFPRKALIAHPLNTEH